MVRLYRSLVRLLSGKWRASLVYDLVAPIALAAVMLVFANTSVFERLENLTVDMRFRVRAAEDPLCHPQLLLVQIDQPSLDAFGAWPWSRDKHGDFCKLLAVNDPAVVAFDVFFTEAGNAEADAYLVEGAQTLPRMVTGAITDHKAHAVNSAAMRTKPIRSIVGDRNAIHGKAGAQVPIPALGTVSWMGFVDSDPASDGVRRLLPMLLRVGDEVYPSFALQTLMLAWNVSSDQVAARLGHWIELPGPDGPRQIPITAKGELRINYRAKASFTQRSYQPLMTELYLDSTGDAPIPANLSSVKGKIVVVGQNEPGLSDMGPSPFEANGPLVLTHLNALNSILKNDYLRVVPLMPWAISGWLLIAWSTLLGLRNEHIVRSLLLPVGILTLYVSAAVVLFAYKSVSLPIALPVVTFALVHVGKVITEWIERVFAERRVSAELLRTTEAKKLLEQELSIAREIQMSTLPQIFPPFPDRPEIDLHAIMIPAKYVGGDLYEFFFVGEDKLFFVIGDVSGKGVPAALFMTMALAVIRSNVIAGRSPAETLRIANNVLALRNERCTFVTIFCGLLDTATGQVRYSNGGHNPPVLMDGEGGVRFLEAEGTAIGAIDGLDFDERELTLQPNQGLFLYTDGVTEAIDHKEELFSDDRLMDTLKVRHRAFSAEQMVTRVNTHLTTFVGGAAQFDDITALALFYRGKPNGTEVASKSPEVSAQEVSV